MIVDDCSTDNTFEICKQYAEKDSRIKLFRNEVNSKIVFSNNRALINATGKYIVRMDSDDVSDKYRLEKMKTFLDEHKDIKLVGTSAITINFNGEEIGQTVFLSDFEIIKKTCLLKCPVVHIWMTYKEIYDELENYRNLFTSEDYDFVLRLMSKGYKCTNMSDYFGYKIRVNRLGNTSSTYGVKKLKTHTYVANLYKERLKNGKDNYSYESYQNAIKTFRLTEKIYSLSNNFLYKAIESKAHKNYIKMCIYVLCSLISPYQIAYLYQTAKYKFLTRGTTK